MRTITLRIHVFDVMGNRRATIITETSGREYALEDARHAMSLRHGMGWMFANVWIEQAGKRTFVGEINHVEPREVNRD